MIFFQFSNYMFETGLFLKYSAFFLKQYSRREMKKNFCFKPVSNKLKIDLQKTGTLTTTSIGVPKDEKQNKMVGGFPIIDGRSLHLDKVSQKEWIHKASLVIRQDFKGSEEQSKQKIKCHSLNTQGSSVIQKTLCKSGMLGGFSLNKKNKGELKSISSKNMLERKKQNQVAAISNQIYIECLKNNIVSTKAGNLSLKRQIFVELLSFIICSLTGIQNRGYKIDTEIFQPIRKKLSQYQKQVFMIQKIKKSKISRQVAQTICLDEEIQRTKLILSNIQDLEEERTKLEKRNKKNQQSYSNTLKENKILQKQIAGQQKKKYELQKQYKQLKQINDEMMKEIKQSQNFLKKIKEESFKLTYFVEIQSKRPALHEISYNYKKIEKEILKFAEELQQDSMEKSINWKSEPFTEIEKQIQEEFERVSQIINSQSRPLDQKYSQLRLFITDLTSKWRSNDKQITELSNMKTEVIWKFVQMMQQWMASYELKQDYLTGLRSQFIVDTEQLKQFLLQIQGCHQNQQIKRLLQDLNKCWVKIEENYKWGNSFY